MICNIIFLITFGQVAAFHVFNRQLKGLSLLYSTDEENAHLDLDPIAGFRSIDIARAKDCAEHFGKCSVDEIEDLRNNLHKERLQQFLFEPKSSAALNDVALEYHILENELDLQLSMLQEHKEMGSFNLFPEAEKTLMEISHLEENTASKQTNDMIHKSQQTLIVNETIMEESVLETVAMCLVVALLCFAPQFLRL